MINTVHLAVGPCCLNIPRIYLPIPLQSGMSVALDDRTAHHLTHVLRLKPGAALVVFNGKGGEYEATLGSMTRGQPVAVNVARFIARSAESRLTVRLAQGISRGERMDYAVQKAVELGVAHIVPLVTEFCVVNIHKEREEKRMAHWRGIIITACEQCGRMRVPTIAAPIRLHNWLAQAESDVRLMFDPYATQRLTELPRPSANVTLLIGPEGGLSDKEAQAARNAGFMAVQLGPRMLRTETAPVAALSAVQTLWGDLG